VTHGWVKIGSGFGLLPLKWLVLTDLPLKFPPRGARVRPLIDPAPSSGTPGVGFPGPSQGDRLAVSPGFINVIGVLLPMAPWGRTSL